MKKRVLVLVAMLTSLALFTTGCSTTSQFKIPANSKLTVYDRVVEPAGPGGVVKTRPFFWSATGGIPYSLQDESGKMLREGKLKARFRVMSIFWPPFALIYWPMGFGAPQYDLTREADGVMVRDTHTAKMHAAPAATPAAPAKTKKSK